MPASRIFLIQIAFLLCVTLASPSSGAADYLRIPREELVARVHVIGILPVINEVGFGEPSTALDEELAKDLRAAGFEVRDAAEYREIELQVRKQNGGWFDPLTGHLDQRKRDALLKTAMDLYQAQHKVDSFVRAQIQERQLRFTDDKHVQWDGVEENIVFSEGLLAKINHVQGILDTGDFSVLTTFVGLYDTSGNLLYQGHGGIGARSARVMKQFTPVDVAGLLSDGPRMAQAADISLRDLLSPSKTGKEQPARLVSVGSLMPDDAMPQAVPPVHTSRAETQKVVKTIAILSIDPGNVGYREDIRAIYYNRLSQCLKDAGYEVVSRWAVDHAFEDASEQAGGTFDPVTGARSESKMTQVAQTQIRELEERNHVDALLYVSFPTSRAPFDSKGSVEWDGLTRSAFSAGAHIDSSAHIQGFARTLSFSVRLTDLNNNVLYTKRIGADLLSLFNGIYFLEASRTKIQLDEGRALELAKSALSELTE